MHFLNRVLINFNMQSHRVDQQMYGLVTTRKRILRQRNAFTRVCHSVHRWGWLPSMHHRSHDRGVCIQRGLPKGEVGQPPPPRTRKVYGMHPTGILSPYHPQRNCRRVMFSQASETPLDIDPLDRHPPLTGTPGTVTSGRYTSYWNVFLFSFIFTCQNDNWKTKVFLASCKVFNSVVLEVGRPKI